MRRQRPGWAGARLAAGPDAVVRQEAAMQVHRVLCPVDLSDPSLRALHHAAALAACHGATLHVLHVVPDVVPPVLPLMLALPHVAVDEVPTQVAQALESFLARAALSRPPIAVIRQGPVVAAIVGYAVEI